MRSAVTSSSSFLPERALPAGPEWLTERVEAGAAAAAGLDLPGRGDETWKYLDLDVDLEALITARGAELKNLPPYSPDLSPIELCWSAFKEKLRKAAARSFKALIKAVKEALESVTPEQVRVD